MGHTSEAAAVDFKFGTFEGPLGERYKFEQELGRGAMGTVYRAKDLRLGRAVAIKMLHPTLTNELGVGRFESETRIAARLHHQNIISVHESGEVEGRLFYVMDYFGGETLRARLKREKQLSIEDAVRITEQVAAGLQHAHDHGVVHRDIKPENIILAEGQARIVDFGIAIALESVDEERLTATGLSVGTPHYISPEQAAAERDIGPQADQYALACVLFEMLAGEPPFTGPAASVIRRHITEVPPRLRTRRSTTPYEVDLAVARALEKVPADRYGSVRELMAALREPIDTGTGDPAAPRVKWIAIMAALLVAAVATGIAVSGDTPVVESLRSIVTRSLDSTRYVVFPVATGEGLQDGAFLDQRFRDAFARWSGLSVPRLPEVRAAMDGRTAMTPDQGKVIARAVRARYFVVSEASSDGSNVRITADIVDASGRVGSRRAMVTLPAGTTPQDTLFDQLVFELLYGSGAMRLTRASRGTRSHEAMAAFVRATSAMATWRLAVADSALTRALRADPSFPHASLALATVRFWAQDPSADVSRLAISALDGSDQLSPTDVLHATALRDLSEARFAESCARYDSLTVRGPRDFAAWYGLAECHRLDDAVIASARSPSRRAFRGSKQRGTAAINRAFDLMGAVDSCCLARAVQVQRRHFAYVIGTRLRSGREKTRDSMIYIAYPQLDSDTLAFVPYSRDVFESRTTPSTHTAAVDQQRRAYFRLASKRAVASPNDPDVLGMLGEAVELQGYPSAVDTVRRARGLARSRAQAVRLAVNEVWLRVKAAIPDDTSALRAARALADSLLAHTPQPSYAEAVQLSSLAALVGDLDRTRELAQHVDPSTLMQGVPLEVKRAGDALLVTAAAGGKPDKLRELETRLLSAIRNGVVQQEQHNMRVMFLGRATALAYPQTRLSAFSTLDTSQMLLAAEVAHHAQKFDVVRRVLERPERIRRNMRAADITLDALYPEAWLLAAAHDTAGALRRIGETLDAISLMPVRQLTDAVVAGCLVQSLSLRAALLTAQGNRVEGRRWARAAAALTDTTSSSARTIRATALQLSR